MKSFIYHKINLFADLITIWQYSQITDIKLISPFYHSISDSPLHHLDCLYKVRNSREFEKDIDFLLKHFQPVSLQTLISLVKENRNPEKPSFFLSFDDGLSEFHDVIAPILLRKGVPATCFLNSAFIDNKDLFYRYKACLLLHELENEKANMMPVFNRWIKNEGLSPVSPQRFLLDIEYSQKKLIDELAEIFEFSFEEYLKTKKPYLTSTQIGSLINKGFTFGSHSIDHPGFSVISDDVQFRQVVESTLEITRNFSLPYKVFSFPFTDYGLGMKFFDNINKSVNFDLTFGCAGIKKDSWHNHIQRIPLEEFNIGAKKRIKRDYFYYILKAFLNRNTITRK